jgi:cytochrome c oxidase subunit 2
MKRLSLALAVLSAAACQGRQAVLDPGGPQAAAIAWLTWWLFGVCFAVYLAVAVLATWALVRRGASIDESPAAGRRMAVSVYAGIGATAAILVVLVVTSAATGRRLLTPSGPGAVTIDVIGHQWWWEFRYRDASPTEWVTSPNELHLPVGETVFITASSRDVIHSFWVPNLTGKRDLVPGFDNHLWLRADRPGVFRGQCAEFCGHQHAKMAFVVIVEPLPDFKRWLGAQRRSAAVPTSTVEQRGLELFMRGSCVLCHTIRGTQAGSRVGPDLTHVASRQTIAAGTLPTSPVSLADWVADPQAIKPGVRMPPTPLSDGDRKALASYLASLR